MRLCFSEKFNGSHSIGLSCFLIVPPSYILDTASIQVQPPRTRSSPLAECPELLHLSTLATVYEILSSFKYAVR